MTPCDDLKSTRLTAGSTSPQPPNDPERIVRRFLDQVRSGRNPDAANQFMSATVIAHQLNSEHENAITRTPHEYANHVREMLAEYGSFAFEVTSIVAQHDHVAVTWRQTSAPNARVHTVNDVALVELASCTYRVEDGKIVEYWLLLDRHGMRQQRQPARDLQP